MRIACSCASCQKPAVFKIAAPWHVEESVELKTYGFACVDHLRPVFRSAEARWMAYEPNQEEQLLELGVYRRFQGKLQRDQALEANIKN